MIEGRRELRRLIRGFLAWLGKSKSSGRRIRHSAVFRFCACGTTRCSTSSTCSATPSPRGASRNSTWLSGLYVVAADASPCRAGFTTAHRLLSRPRPGAAIRRAARDFRRPQQSCRDHQGAPRAHGGERIASSLIHEVGTRAPRCLISSRRFGRVAGPAARRRSQPRPLGYGSAGSPRSSPTSGRWRGSASSRRSA